MEMVQTYVANGYGFGVTVHLPQLKLHPEVRVLPLVDFERLSFGLLWQGRKTAVLEGMIRLVERTAKELADKLEG